MNLFYGNYLRQKESHAGSQKGTPRGIPNQRSVSTQPFKPSNAKPLLNCCSNDCSLGKTSGTSSFFASGSRFPSCDWMVVNTLTSTFTSHSIDWRSSLSTLLPMINWQPVEKKTFMYSISFYSEFLWLLPFLLSTGCRGEVRSVHNYNWYLAYVALNRSYITIFMPPQFEPPTV